MSPRRLSFTHRTDSSSVRRAVLTFLKGCQGPDQVEDSLLVITELVQNVVRHTGDGGDVVLTRGPDAVLIEVSDGSPEMPHALAADARRTGGRGLFLVRAMSLAWGMKRVVGGKVVWAKMAATPA
jgi:anti-sigma regulatory factor (Ser/Thr protein kinase)